jgi:hypothetical protein
VTALERAQDLERQRVAVLQQGTEEVVAKIAEAIKELRALVEEQLKSLR